MQLNAGDKVVKGNRVFIFSLENIGTSFPLIFLVEWVVVTEIKLELIRDFAQ
jgi:hypothetical protein